MSAKTNTHGVKAGEICRESTAAGLPVSFFSGKSCWVWAEKVTGSCDCTCFWWALLYFLVLSHVYLSFASHCVVWNLSGTFVGCPKRLGKLVAPFPVRRLSLAGSSLLALSNVGLVPAWTLELFLFMGNCWSCGYDILHCNVFADVWSGKLPATSLFLWLLSSLISSCTSPTTFWQWASYFL